MYDELDRCLSLSCAAAAAAAAEAADAAEAAEAPGANSAASAGPSSLLLLFARHARPSGFSGPLAPVFPLQALSAAAMLEAGARDSIPALPLPPPLRLPQSSPQRPSTLLASASESLWSPGALVLAARPPPHFLDLGGAPPQPQARQLVAAGALSLFDARR